MKKSLFTLVLILSIATSQAQYLVSYELLSTTPASFLPFIPGVPTEYDVKFYKVFYNTVDVHGEPTVATGALAAPVSSNCVGFPMAIYQHGTTLSKEDVPSRENGEGDFIKIIASNGFYTVAPDYIGMGDNPGLHPYVHAESEATAGRDLIRAAREIVLDLDANGTPSTAINEVFITGYSQGGHAAMALHKHIEDNNLLDEFNVLASAPASGPYHLSGAQTEVILSDEPYSNPGYLVYLLSAYELAYGNIYTTYSEVLNSPYDGIVVPYFNGNNTTLFMGSLNSQLPGQISDLMQADYLDAFTNDLSHPLRVALADNDNYDWAPQVPVKIYYCTADEQVNYQNALDAIEAMTAAGATSVEGVNGGPFNHGLCVLPSLSGAANWFISLKSDCQVVGIEDIASDPIDISISPNPVEDQITIQYAANLDYLTVQSVEGKIVREFPLNNGRKISFGIQDLTSGTYVVTFYQHDQVVTSKTIIVE